MEFAVAPADLSALAGRPAREIVSALLPAEVATAALARIQELEVAEAAAGIAVMPRAAEAIAALPANRVAIVTSCIVPLAS